MPRCPNGSRRNKQGVCVKKTAKKRCPNGSRRNKHGVCVKKHKSASLKKLSIKYATPKLYKSPSLKNSVRSLKANYSLSANTDRYFTPRESKNSNFSNNM